MLGIYGELLSDWLRPGLAYHPCAGGHDKGLVAARHGVRHGRDGRAVDLAGVCVGDRAVVPEGCMDDAISCTGSHSISYGAFGPSHPSPYCCVKLGKVIMMPAACCVRSKAGPEQLEPNIQALTGKLSFSPAAAALARTSRSSTVPVRGSPPACLSRSALASDLTRPTASMQSRDIRHTFDRGLDAGVRRALSLLRTALCDCRAAKADVWCAHECGAGRHTDLMPFGKQELDNRSSAVPCGTCHEDLHDASLGVLRAEVLTFRNPEMKKP